MIDIDVLLTNIPLYRILNVRTICPACQGLLPSILWGLLLSVIPSLAFLLASIKSTTRFSRFMIMSWPTWLFFARALLAAISIFIGSPWLSYLATFNLASLPLDFITYRVLIMKQRVSLALLPILNIPLLPPYLIPTIGTVVLLLARRGAPPSQSGIVLGVADHAATYTPIYIMDKSSTIQSAQRDWVIRRLGRMVVTWDPRAEGNPHLLIAGASGMGKSTLMYYLVVKLLLRGYPVTIIDPLGQYAVFARALDMAVKSGDQELVREMFLTNFPERVVQNLRVRIYDVVEHGIDVFKPIAGEPLLQVAEDLSYAISVVERQTLGATQHEWIIRSVSDIARSVVRRAAIKEAQEVKPSLWKVVERIERDAEMLYEKRRFKTYEAIMNLAVRIRLLARYLEPKDQPIEPEMLEARSVDGFGELVVLDLSTIKDDDVKAIAMELLLRKLNRYIENRPLSPPERPWYIVVDEAWILMRHMSDYKSIVNEMIRKVRNRGVGMILLTQRLSDLSKDALANIGTKICLRLADGTDVNELVEYTGCHLLREAMGQLAQHQAVIIKRLSSLERVADASMYASSADILLFTRLAHLYPNKEIWQRAEEEISEERRRTLEALDRLELEIVAEKSGRDVIVAKERKEEDDNKQLEEQQFMQKEVVKPDMEMTSRPTLTQVGQGQKGSKSVVKTTEDAPPSTAPSQPAQTAQTEALKLVNNIYVVVGSIISSSKNEKLKSTVNSLSPEEIVVLISHITTSAKTSFRIHEPIAKALHDLGLGEVEDGKIKPFPDIISIVNSINASKVLWKWANTIAKMSCIECLKLTVNGRCPSCGKMIGSGGVLDGRL